MPETNRTMKNLALLKTLRQTGADGELLRGIIGTKLDFDFIALEREGKLEELEEYLKRQVSVIKNPIKRFPGRLLFIFKIFKMLLAYKSQSIFKTKKTQICTIASGSPELAFLAEIAGLRAQYKYYLLADLTRFHTHHIAKYLVRFIEKYCINRGWRPVVTSPGFYEAHYKLMGIKKESILITHNTPQSKQIEYDKTAYCPSSIKIAWAGLLRCNISAQLLIEACQGYGKSVFTVDMYGLTNWINSDLIDQIKGIDSITLFGKYQQSEILSLHINATYTWCCDWSLGANSMNLVANRFYYGLLSATPLIASKGSYMAKIIEQYNIGLAIDHSKPHALNILLNISIDQYSEWVNNIQKISKKIPHESHWIKILEHNNIHLMDHHIEGKLFD